MSRTSATYFVVPNFAWIRRANAFNRGTIAALADRPRFGRPRKAGDRYFALLREAVQREPRDVGYVFGRWTLERLREHVARKTRVTVSVAYLSRLTVKHELVYWRPKHGMTHLCDPREYDEKKAFLAFVEMGPSDRARPSTCSTSTSVRFTSTCI